MEVGKCTRNGTFYEQKKFRIKSQNILHWDEGDREQDLVSMDLQHLCFCPLAPAKQRAGILPPSGLDS